jgi:prevent-host-death family protein
MKWTIAKARRHFADLIRGAADEPQPVFNRDKLVAAVIDAESYREFSEWRRQKGRTVAQAFDELRQVCADEHYTLELLERRDRANAFTETID